MASTASSSSWSLMIHLTPARLIPSSASSTAADRPRTTHWPCSPSTSATDSENPVMYIAPATHCKGEGGGEAGVALSSSPKAEARAEAHLAEHVEEAHRAPHPAAQDGGDHGVDPAAPNAAVLGHPDPRHHRDQSHHHDQGDQEHPEEHARVPLDNSRETNQPQRALNPLS